MFSPVEVIMVGLICLATGSLLSWVTFSLLVVGRSGDHGLGDEELLAERAMLTEQDRLDAKKRSNRAARSLKTAPFVLDDGTAYRPPQSPWEHDRRGLEPRAVPATTIILPDAAPPGGLGRWGERV